MPDAMLLLYLALAALAYVLVTCVLGTLATRVKNQRDRHDLLVEVKRRQEAYLAALRDEEIEVGH